VILWIKFIAALGVPVLAIDRPIILSCLRLPPPTVATSDLTQGKTVSTVSHNFSEMNFTKRKQQFTTTVYR
jgi:hypothetical protein